MLEDNVEIVRSGLEHFAATDEFLGVLTPDFVWDMSTFRGWPDKPIFEGIDGLREFLAMWREPYDEWSMTLDEVLDAGDNRVLALLRQSGRPHGSDSEVHLQYGLLATVEVGQIRLLQAYATSEEALSAAGLDR